MLPVTRDECLPPQVLEAKTAEHYFVLLQSASLGLDKLLTAQSIMSNLLGYRIMPPLCLQYDLFKKTTRGPDGKGSPKEMMILNTSSCRETN